MDLPRIPDSEFRIRWERLQAAMAGAGLDLVIATMRRLARVK